MCSHLMFYSSLRRPQFIADIEELERVQERATRSIVNNYHLSYTECLTNLSVSLKRLSIHALFS